MDDRAAYVAIAVIICGLMAISLFVVLVRLIARREIEKVLKGYIAGHVLRPRNKRGQFEAR